MAYRDTVLALSPVAYWELQESSGAQASDSSGNGHHGTYVGSPALAQSDVPAGMVGDTSILLNGSSQYVDFPTSGYGLTDEATLAVWLKLASNSPSTNQTGLGRFDSVGQASHYPWTDTDLYITWLNTSRYNTSPNSSFDKSLWHLFAVRTAPGANNWGIWQNDSEFENTTGPASIPAFANARLGYSISTYYMQGHAIHLALFDYRLSDANLLSLYTSGVDAPGDPRILSARQSESASNKIRVFFSEVMDNDRLTPGNYTLTPSVSVTGAVDGADENEVELTAALAEKTTYQLDVNAAVQDLGGNALSDPTTYFQTGPIGANPTTDAPPYVSGLTKSLRTSGDSHLPGEGSVAGAPPSTELAVSSVVRIDDNTIRVTFNVPAKVNQGILSTDIYTFSPTGPVVTSVTPNATPADYVDLTITEQKQGESYTVTIEHAEAN